MHVFEITLPGIWLDDPDREWAWRIQIILSLLEGEFTNAVVALNLFLEENAKWKDALRPEGRPEDVGEGDAFRQALEKELRAQIGEDRFFRQYVFIQEEIEREVKRQEWRQGGMPVEYRFRLPFIFAHAYLYALDSFEQILGRLVKESAVPPAVQKELDRFRAAFPRLRDIRNSAHHIEDRGRGYGRDEKPLDLKPIATGMIRAPGGGVLVLRNLNGDQLGYTLEDGSFTEIAVSVKNTEQLASVFQGVLDAVRWKGRTRHIPS